MDDAGNVYVADWQNDRIRKVTPTGDVSTLATVNNAFGLALDRAGSLYVGTPNDHRVVKVAPGGTPTTVAGSGSRGAVDGTGTAASFLSPTGLDFDAAGNLYVLSRALASLK